MRRYLILILCVAALGASFVSGYSQISGPISETTATPLLHLDFYDAAGLRDPFVPLIVPTPTLTPTATKLLTSTITPLEGTPTNTPTVTPTPVELPFVDLQVILSNGLDSNVAVIDNKLVVPGSEIGDILVKEIRTHEVVLVYCGVEFIRPLPDSPEKEKEKVIGGTSKQQKSTAFPKQLRLKGQKK